MLAPTQLGSQMPGEHGFAPPKFGAEVKSSSVIARRERDFFEYSNKLLTNSSTAQHLFELSQNYRVFPLRGGYDRASK